MKLIALKTAFKERKIKEKELMSRFAKNIKWLRDVHSVTQNEIAAYLKIDRSSYCNYELERTIPKIFTVIRIADFYDMTVDDLINRDLEEQRSARGA